MTQVAFEKTNLIQELRLRRWARSNYILPHMRNDEKWHPIVLDEMRIKDEELRETRFNRVSGSSIVPLPHTPFHQTVIASGHIVHTGHTQISRTSLAPIQRETDSARSETSSQLAE